MAFILNKKRKSAQNSGIVRKFAPQYALRASKEHKKDAHER